MTKKITFPRWPSEFPANLCRPVCLGGLTGWHWLAGNSEGHRGISKFLFLMIPCKYYEALATGIKLSFWAKLFQKVIFHHSINIDKFENTIVQKEKIINGKIYHFRRSLPCSYMSNKIPLILKFLVVHSTQTTI